MTQEKHTQVIALRGGVGSGGVVVGQRANQESPLISGHHFKPLVDEPIRRVK